MVTNEKCHEMICAATVSEARPWIAVSTIRTRAATTRTGNEARCREEDQLVGVVAVVTMTTSTSTTTTTRIDVDEPEVSWVSPTNVTWKRTCTITTATKTVATDRRHLCHRPRRCIDLDRRVANRRLLLHDEDPETRITRPSRCATCSRTCPWATWTLGATAPWNEDQAGPRHRPESSLANEKRINLVLLVSKT